MGQEGIEKSILRSKDLLGVSSTTMPVRLYWSLTNGNSVLMYMGIVNTGYSTSFFTPTILTQLGWTSIRAQVMSIPIYIVATVLAITTAVVTDRIKHRFGAIIIGCCVATIGYAILLNMEHVPVGARYFALYLITGGGYIAQPVTIVWLSNNVGGHYKRGALPNNHSRYYR